MNQNKFDSTDDFLAHYGVLGMKWGVRKDRGSQGRKKTVTRQDIGGKNKKVSAKKAAKLDRKFEKKAISNKNYFAVYNKVARQLNNYIPELNAKYEKYDFDGEDFDNPSPKYKQYLDDYKNKTNALLKDASASMIGTNATGTAHVEFTVAEAGVFPDMQIVYDDVKHASGDTRPTIIKLKWNKGKIVGLRLVNDSDSTDDSLAHYGILGMKWGIRKDGQSSTKTSSGESKGKSVNFKSNSRSSSATVRSDMTVSELKKVNERLRLEIELNRYINELSKANQTRPQKVKSEVQDILKTAAKNTVINLTTAQLTKGTNAATDMLVQMGKEALKTKMK